MSKVLVTGGSGFVGSHCILALLAAGYEVRTTVRNLNREDDVRAMLRMGGAEPGNRLTFVTADLEKDSGWNVAVAGCEFVHHVASPFPAGPPKHENDLIIPAREGALRVLRASRDAGVKTGGVDVVVCGHRLREHTAGPALRRARLVQSGGGHWSLPQVEDPG